MQRLCNNLSLIHELVVGYGTLLMAITCFSTPINKRNTYLFMNIIINEKELFDNSEKELFYNILFVSNFF